MQWIAPSEKDTASATLEKQLWAAADQLRANSGLKAAEYSAPVLGLIFLRFAEARFSAQRAKLEHPSTSGRGAGGEGAAVPSRRGNRAEDPTAYHAEGMLYLPAEARFDHLLHLPEAANVGAKVNDAMRAIEQQNPQLAGVLPKTYTIFGGTLLKQLLKKMSEIPISADYDTFGRVYEYFLAEFAMTEGQGGGEFYTPFSIVRLLTEVIEPYHGRILDPACGSGGMFVQSARFVSEHRRNPAKELAIYGQEKERATGDLCRMNLAVHGLEGDIKQAISYYDDPHAATGRFDFVLANPPFNVNAVDKERLADAVGPGRRFPHGLPRTDNANYVWIQLFASALNTTGRAGFVMANSASDARASEQEIRQKLIESRVVDVMVAVGPNMFYTVTLPCTLWFFDKGKAKTPRADTVLFIDARHIYRQVDRAHREWTPAQIGFIANLVRLYRGEAPDYTLGGDEAGAKLAEVFSSAHVRSITEQLRGLKLMHQREDVAVVAELLDVSITGAEIAEEGPPPLDLSRIDFEALSQRFKRSKTKNTDLEVLKAAIRAQLDKLIRINRTRADYLDKFEELIEAYNHGSRSIEELFEELLKLSRSLSEEQKRHVRENLSEDELTTFDLLTRPDPALTDEERAEVKKVARILHDRLKDVLTLDWRQKASARASVLTAIKDVLDEGLPRAYTPEIYEKKCSTLFEHIYETGVA